MPLAPKRASKTTNEKGCPMAKVEVQMTDELHGQVKETATEDGRSVAGWLRWLAQRECDRRKAARERKGK